MQRRTRLFIIIPTGLIAIFLALAFYISTDRSEPVAYVNSVQTTPRPSSDKIFDLVNEERVKAGIAPLINNDNVRQSAQLKADDMRDRDYFSHNLPGTKKVLTAEMNELLVAACTESSENIAWVSKTHNSEGAIDLWMTSPPHKAAILDSKYTHTGVGVAGDKIVQHFCIAK